MVKDLSKTVNSEIKTVVSHLIIIQTKPMVGVPQPQLTSAPPPPPNMYDSGDGWGMRLEKCQTTQ